MNDKLTDITIILDRSGSMSAIRQDTIGGINTFIADQKAFDGDATLTLVQFDDKYEVNYTARDLKEVSLLGINDFVPRGSTALLDAMGRTINSAGERLAAIPEDQRPGKVLFVIMTDGFENASREFRYAQIKEMVEHQTTQYNWQFVYLGANQDAILVGQSIGIGASNSMTYVASPAGVQTAHVTVNKNTRAFRIGQTETYTFTQEDRDAQEELLKNGGTGR